MSRVALDGLRVSPRPVHRLLADQPVLTSGLMLRPQSNQRPTRTGDTLDAGRRVKPREASEVHQPLPGLWCWSSPHPEWTPGHGWDEDVWAYCVDTGDTIVLIDPIALRGDVPDPVDSLISSRGRPVVVALSRAGHFRDSALFARRFDATIFAEARAQPRVPQHGKFQPVSAGDSIPGGASVLPFDVPGLDHTPLYLPSHRAIVPGDILVRTEGELRLWWVPEDENDIRFLNERHVPALRRWLEQPVEHILTSHGEPVLGGGGEELAAAFARPIWAVS